MHAAAFTDVSTVRRQMLDSHPEDFFDFDDELCRRLESEYEWLYDGYRFFRTKYEHVWFCILRNRDNKLHDDSPDLSNKQKSRVHGLYINGLAWLGRFVEGGVFCTPEKAENVSHAMITFNRLAKLANDEFPAPSKRDISTDFEEDFRLYSGRFHGWIETVYTTIPHAINPFVYDSTRCMVLPWNVFHASALAIEILMSDKKDREPLTDREKEVFDYVKEHGSVVGKEISNALDIPLSSLTRHTFPSLKSKRGLKNLPGSGYCVEDE
jgi:hypothetical protein